MSNRTVSRSALVLSTPAGGALRHTGGDVHGDVAGGCGHDVKGVALGVKCCKAGDGARGGGTCQRDVGTGKAGDVQVECNVEAGWGWYWSGLSCTDMMTRDGLGCGGGRSTAMLACWIPRLRFRPCPAPRPAGRFTSRASPPAGSATSKDVRRIKDLDVADAPVGCVQGARGGIDCHALHIGKGVGDVATNCLSEPYTAMRSLPRVGPRKCCPRSRRPPCR